MLKAQRNFSSRLPRLVTERAQMNSRKSMVPSMHGQNCGECQRRHTSITSSIHFVHFQNCFRTNYTEIHNNWQNYVDYVLVYKLLVCRCEHNGRLVCSRKLFLQIYVSFYSCIPSQTTHYSHNFVQIFSRLLSMKANLKQE